MNFTLEDWEQLLSNIERNTNPNFDEGALPTDFGSALLPKNNPLDFKETEEAIFSLIHCPDTNRTLQFLVDNPRISALTSATGFPNDMQLLHHFSSSGNKHYAFSGLRTSANVLELIPSRFTHTNTSKAPSLDTLRNPHNLRQINTLQFEEDQLVSFEAPNSIIITPNIAKILTVNGNLTCSPSEALALVATHLIEENARLKAIHESTLTDEDGILDLNNHQEWDDGPITTAMPLIQALYAWSKQRSPRSISFRPSQNPQTLELLSTITSRFTVDTSTEEIDSRSHTHDHLPPRTNTQENVQPTVTNPFTPPDTSGTSFDRFISNFNASQTQQTVAISKLSHTLGEFANATAANTKSKQKIGKQITNLICNAMTPDGENPATKLTETLTDMMKGSNAEIKLNLDIILNKHNAPATPTPDFIRAVKNGDWVHDPGKPSGITVFNLPHSLANTIFETFDLGRLEEEQKHGRNLTDAEREAMYSKQISVSRTLNTLLAKTKSYAAFLKESLGPGIPASDAADEWTAFLTNNLNDLHNRQRLCDPHLPARLESLIASQFNEWFGQSRFGVPPISVLATDSVRQHVLRGYLKPDIPKSIEEALNPPKNKNDDRKRKGGPNDLQSGSDKRPNRTVPHPHENQPREFSMGTDKFKLLVQNSISKNLVKVPMAPSAGCTECCKYIFLGQCHSRCPRVDAHSPPAGNKPRMDALRKLLKDCHLAYKDNKNPSDPDFH